MTENGHLITYSLALTVKTPVFIGSGSEYKKTDYILDTASGRVSVINREVLFEYLAKLNLADKYERFVLSRGSRLENFLKNDCRMDDATIKKCCKYTVSAGDALDENHSLKDIKEFVKNSSGNVYIPGSSLKGALRTALMYLFIKRKGSLGGEMFLNQRDRTFTAEKSYFSKLYFEKAKTQSAIINDIMRGVEVSDSLPVSDDSLILCTKIDVKPDGTAKKLPICRECLKPGTVVRFALTFDTSVLHKWIGADDVIESISEFSDYYYDNYVRKFKTPQNTGYFDYADKLMLGGGVGYFSKTVTYPYCGYKAALDKVTRFFIEGKQTRKHHHESDYRYGISPHTLKYTSYQQKLLPMGLCEVDIK